MKSVEKTQLLMRKRNLMCEPARLCFVFVQPCADYGPSRLWRRKFPILSERQRHYWRTLQRLELHVICFSENFHEIEGSKA